MLRAALRACACAGLLLAAQSCTVAPPSPWRHWGCHRWDCGDFVSNGTEECKGSATSTLCSSWQCGEGPGLQATGSFACVGGDWADVLPTCLGPTYPGSPGGSWIGVNYSVRAVLFQLHLSWIPASVYQPEVCSGRTNGGSLLLPCQRQDLPSLILNQIWQLLLFPLQADLCRADLPLDVPNTSWECKGRLSQYGDRVRLAGVKSELEGQVGLQNLTFFLEAVPARGRETEALLSDLLALYGAFGGGLPVPAATWHGSGTGLPQEAAWLAEGLRQLLDSPLLFNIKVDPNFFKSEWLPSLWVRLQEPYIINRHTVPGWRLLTLPEVDEDRNLQHLQIVEEVENNTFNIFLSIMVVAWAATATCRTCLWRVFYGRTWNFLNSIRTVCRLGLLTDVIELLVYLTILALALFLTGNGHSVWDPSMLYNEDIAAEELLLSMLALPFPAIFPSSVVLLQMLQAPPLPARTRACYVCCRLKKIHWAWNFCLTILWHAMASCAAFTSACYLLSILRQDRPGFDEAFSACQKDLEGLCDTTDWRQVPDTRWENHLKCGLQCSDVRVPSNDVILCSFKVVCKLVALCAAWSILVRAFLLWISCRILKIAIRTRASSNPRQPSAAPEAQAATETTQVLTPSLFQQGSEAARTPRTPRTPRETGQGANAVESSRIESSTGGPELSEEGKARQLQILEAAMALDETPSPSGSVVNLGQNPGPTASELRRMLENPLTEGHAELVDFAKSIARECTKESKDSAMSDGSVISSRSGRCK